MLIKVCGMREADNIRAVESLGIDWMGFIFWPGSSRFVSERPTYLPSGCKRVGVFVDAALDEVRRKIDEYALDVVQFHGHESPAYVEALTDVVRVKAISIASRDDIAQWHHYEGVVDYFLFDTKCRTVGGSGEHFDWTVLDHYDGPVPFLLSGGIGPDDAQRLQAFRHPMLAGLDLNSRFELSPGLKDVALLRRFLNS